LVASDSRVPLVLKKRHLLTPPGCILISVVEPIDLDDLLARIEALEGGAE